MYRYRNPSFDHNNKEHRMKAMNLKLSFIKYIIDATVILISIFNNINPFSLRIHTMLLILNSLLQKQIA